MQKVLKIIDVLDGHNFTSCRGHNTLTTLYVRITAIQLEAEVLYTCTCTCTCMYKYTCTVCICLYYIHVHVHVQQYLMYSHVHMCMYNYCVYACTSILHVHVILMYRSAGRAVCLECRTSRVQVPPEAALLFLWEKKELSSGIVACTSLVSMTDYTCTSSTVLAPSPPLPLPLPLLRSRFH